MKQVKYILFSALFLIGFVAFSQKDIPQVNRLVVDETGFLSEREKSALEQELNRFSKETSNQILVYINTDLGGYDISDFAIRLGQKNKVGQSKFDNGVVMVIKPKTANERGQAFISVGYGLEGAIPDITTKQIVENELIPNFKQQQNYQGIIQAVGVIENLAQGEFNHSQYGKSSKKKKKGIWSGIISFLLVAFIMVFSMTKRVRRYGAANNLGFWAAFALLNASSNRHGGHFSNFNSGGGSFGGGGGGGFGGFGGGSFGGGGAGGSW